MSILERLSIIMIALGVVIVGLASRNILHRVERLEEIHPNKIVHEKGFDKSRKRAIMKIKKWGEKNAKKAGKR